MTLCISARYRNAQFPKNGSYQMIATATANIPTAKASGYLQQLCKHFGHKAKVDFDPKTGWIEFAFGRSDMTAEPEALTITAAAENADDLEKLKMVMSSHLERFAFREDLEISWS